MEKRLYKPFSRAFIGLLAGLLIYLVWAGTVTQATGGTTISADTARIGGTGAWTTITGPTYQETANNDLTAGSVVLTLPAGFEFNTAAAVLVILTAGSNTVNRNINNVAVNGNIARAAGANLTITATTITFQITDPSQGSVRNTFRWQGIQVRPVNGTPLATGAIVPSGTSNIRIRANSTNFGTLTMVAGAPTRLAIGTQPNSAVAGSPINTSALTVSIQDQFGNTVTSNTSTVSLAIGNNPGAGSLNGTASLAAVAGVATFSTPLSVNKTGTAYTLVASSGSLTSITSAAFNITPGVANKLGFFVQPTNTLAGAVMSPVEVQIQDALGNLVPTASSSITLGIGANPGSGTLSGTLTLATTNGAAIFSDLSINNGGTGYTLVASAPGLANGTSNSFAITVQVSNFDVVEVGAARATNLFTKLANTSFSVDILALDASNNLSSAYAGTVAVELVNASTGGGVCTAMASLQSAGSANGFASGRMSFSFTYPNAVKAAKVRVTDAVANVTSCSTDVFTIRPIAFTAVGAFTASAVALNNVSSSGTPRAVAGSGSFGIIAATGLTGYAGTPKHDNAAIKAHDGAKQNGVVSGLFPASVTGATPDNTNFTYSEVGNFKFIGAATNTGNNDPRGIYDDSFTDIEAAGDCTNDYSNELTGGKYGCKFGIAGDTSYFGRFYPKDFLLTVGSVTNRVTSSCSPASAFTYSGEDFQVTFTLTARNGAALPTVVANYDPVANFSHFNASVIANLGLGAIDLADSTAPTGATALTPNLTLVSSAGTWLNGSVPITARLKLNRVAAPNGPYESLTLGADPVDPVDTDVKLSSYDLDTTVPADTNDRGLVASTKVRHGRLHFTNAHGSELLALPMNMRTQYWNGTAYIPNADDSCTSLASANFALAAGTGSAITTTISGSGNFASGLGKITLTKPDPVPTGKGSVFITPAAGLSSYLPGGPGVATFGIYKSGPIIYMRELY